MKQQCNCDATHGRLRNSTPRQLSKPVFSQLHCNIVSLFQAVLTCFCDSFASLDGMKVANFVFVQLTEQEPGIYDKCHRDYAGCNKIDFAQERIAHEMMESGSWLCSFKTI
jgi:hypothetical protein